MAKSTKGRLLFITAGVACLASAAIVMWRRLENGSADGGVLMPMAFAFLGIFWLLYAFKATDKKDA